jgi:hypothetical protein
VGGSFHVVFTDDHYGTSMPGAGAVHLIKTFENLERYDRNLLGMST